MSKAKAKPTEFGQVVLRFLPSDLVKVDAEQAKRLVFLMKLMARKTVGDERMAIVLQEELAREGVRMTRKQARNVARKTSTRLYVEMLEANWNDTFTKVLAEAVEGIKPFQGLKLVKAVFEAAAFALEKDYKLNIPGFGTFDVRPLRRNVRHPGTGEEIPFDDRVIRFTPSKKLNRMIRDKR